MNNIKKFNLIDRSIFVEGHNGMVDFAILNKIIFAK